MRATAVMATRAARILVLAFAAVALAPVGARAASDTGSAEARLLGEIATTGDRVYWGCRANACSINIRFRNREARQTKVEGTNFVIGPPTQVWLLRADGSHIAAVREVPTLQGASNFEFPPSAQDEAFAAVVRIGDKLHTWWLAAGR